MSDKLSEARQLIRKGLGLSTYQRVSALSAAVDLILDYLEEAE